MGKDSSIQWTDHTSNPWRGCTKVSPGCAHCYAETLSKRNPGTLGVWGPSGTRVVASESKWREPLAWDREAKKLGKQRRVFCASLADVFEEWDGPMLDSRGRRLWIEPKDPAVQFRVCENRDGSFLPHESFRPVTMNHVRRRLARLIWETPSLDWQLVTKRPENAGQMIYEMWYADAEWPKNYWLGVSVEDGNAKRRIDILRTLPVPLRFLSVEPLLEDLGLLDLTGIAWVIVGGESGPHARPFDLAWARSIRDQCRAAGVAFFMKQVGAKPMGKWHPEGTAINWNPPVKYWELKDSHGGDEAKWPEDLRGCRAFPRSEVTVAQA